MRVSRQEKARPVFLSDRNVPMVSLSQGNALGNRRDIIEFITPSKTIPNDFFQYSGITVGPIAHNTRIELNPIPID